MDYCDTYFEVEGQSKGLFKDKGSKFISFVFSVKSEQEVKNYLETVKKSEYSARHLCYAYILNPNQSIQKDNDDGEPTHSAGKPILGQILNRHLTNTLIIVVRYYGGVKLGVGGLIQAYKTAASDALQHINIQRRYVLDFYEVDFRYEDMNQLMRIVKEHSLNVVNQNFEMNCKLTFSIRNSQSKKIQSIFEHYHTLTLKYLKTQ